MKTKRSWLILVLVLAGGFTLSMQFRPAPNARLEAMRTDLVRATVADQRSKGGVYSWLPEFMLGGEDSVTQRSLEPDKYRAYQLAKGEFP